LDLGGLVFLGDFGLTLGILAEKTWNHGPAERAQALKEMERYGKSMPNLHICIFHYFPFLL
jgi:hypothetical protein